MMTFFFFPSVWVLRTGEFLSVCELRRKEDKGNNFFPWNLTFEEKVLEIFFIGTISSINYSLIL